jgi:flavin-dependent dehydrogenase
MRELVCSNERARLTLAHASAASPWLSVALEGFGRREVVPMRGLFTIGDAASFIDPFTGSGMLMALESGEMAARVIARRLAQLRKGEGFAELGEDYRALYGAQFNARLRICSLLRRAAFVPGLAATAIRLFGTSEGLRRRLARATRKAGMRDE